MNNTITTLTTYSVPEAKILNDMIVKAAPPRNQINISKERFTPLQTLAEKLKAKQ